MNTLIRRSLVLLCTLQLCFAVFAKPALAVFPIMAEDPLLGMAVADRLQHAFEADALPPELTIGLTPPYVVDKERFLSPFPLLGARQSATPYAASLLREMLGVDVAVTGRLRQDKQGYGLELYVASKGALKSYRYRAPRLVPERLLQKAQQDIALATGLRSKKHATLRLTLKSSYGTFVAGLVDLSIGNSVRAETQLRRAAASLRPEARFRAYADTLTAANENLPAIAGRAPLLAAFLELQKDPIDSKFVARVAKESKRPLLMLWAKLAAMQQQEPLPATSALDYPYARVNDLLAQAAEKSAPLPRLQRGFAALLAAHPKRLSVQIGGLLMAQLQQDVRLERHIAQHITTTWPAFAYSYERLSQAAFALDAPADAVAALQQATRLEPQNDLYWTNLGWAYYLQNDLKASQTASEQAVTLNPEEFIAWYNLGLVQAIYGATESAQTSYLQAIAIDLQDDGRIDAAAMDDLRVARQKHPQQAALSYALATVLEADGQLEKAAKNYQAYSKQGSGVWLEQAREKLAGLRGKAPNLRLSPSLRLGLGVNLRQVPFYLPGDQVRLRFEVTTPGDALPMPIGVTLHLKDAQGAVVAHVSRIETQPLPPNTVGLVIDRFFLNLPENIRAGTYTLVLTVSGRGEKVARKTLLHVGDLTSDTPWTRRLLGRGIFLRSLQTREVLNSLAQADPIFLADLLQELHLAATQEVNLPDILEGRFAGQKAQEVFGSSTQKDVINFLRYLLRAVPNTDGVFADLYARWAVEGTP